MDYQQVKYWGGRICRHLAELTQMCVIC